MEAVHFTNAVKEDLATAVYLGFQRGEYVLPAYRDLVNQIHEIKKTITQSGNIRFDAVRNEKGHQDKFWSFALAETAVSGAEKSRSGFYSQLREKKKDGKRKKDQTQILQAIRKAI